MRKVASLIFVLLCCILTSCAQNEDSYGDACSVLQNNSTKMAIIISSVPTAASYETKKRSIESSLGIVGETSLQELLLDFNADLNTVLDFSGNQKPPSGSKYELVKNLRTNVWDWAQTWSYDDHPKASEVSAIMEGFADIDGNCKD